MQPILMSRPDAFHISYSINPWMSSHIHPLNAERAISQWEALYDALRPFCDIRLIDPVDSHPDLIFTANAGLPVGDTVLLTHFRPIERRGEEPYYSNWFTQNGYRVVTPPRDVFFEGCGDALKDKHHQLIWLGSGIRTSADSKKLLERTFPQHKIMPLTLVTEHFYHLDTCFCPLRDGYVMYYPDAFDTQSLQTIEEIVPEDKRIPVTKEDAHAFACNAIVLNNAPQPCVIFHPVSDTLKNTLEAVGYTVIQTPLDEFHKAGGSAMCLVLQLP